MRNRVFVVAAIVGVFLLALGATLAWGGQASAEDPTPTPVPAECDIETSLGLVNPAWLSLKVGEAPAVVDLSATWTNLGHVSPGAGDATCKVLLIMGAQADQDLNGVYEPIPAGLSVRVEPQIEPNPYPSPTPNPYPGGDVCLMCYQTGVGKAISDCLLGSGPITFPMPDPSTWQYVLAPCEEIDKPFDVTGFGKLTQLNASCSNGIDDDFDGGIDWRNYSPTTPDAACIDVEALVLSPVNPPILAPQASVTKSRQVSIQCDALGTTTSFSSAATMGPTCWVGLTGKTIVTRTRRTTSSASRSR